MQKQKKILFLHGFYASGSCVPALALKETFERLRVGDVNRKALATDRDARTSGMKRATVLTPDLPLHPADAIKLIRDICDQKKPDVLVGNSCGSFYAQMISPIIGVPALLGNSHFKMSDFLRERIGNHQYKSPRANGIQDFTIDEQLVSEFEEMEKHQFDCCNIYNKVRVWGLFGEEDTLAHFEPLFLEHYHNAFHFPGGHTPTADQFKTWYVPLIEKLLLEYPISIDMDYKFEVMVALTYSDKDIEVEVPLSDKEVARIKQLITENIDTEEPEDEEAYVPPTDLLQILEDNDEELFDKFWDIIMPPVFVEFLIDAFNNGHIEQHDDDEFFN